MTNLEKLLLINEIEPGAGDKAVEICKNSGRDYWLEMELGLPPYRILAQSFIFDAEGGNKEYWRKIYFELENIYRTWDKA